MYDELETERLSLRPLTSQDAPRFAQLANNFAIAKMTGTFPYPFPQLSVEGMIDIFLARAVTGRAFHWAILLQGDFMGVVGVSRDDQGWELGYWIGQPFWGHGYAREAVAALLSHMSGIDDKLAITAGVFIDNPASSKLLLKLGFRKRGEKEDSYSVARNARQIMDVFDYGDSPQTQAKTDQTQRVASDPSRSIASVAP